MKSLQAQLRELERLLAKETLESEILREALEIARQKTLLSPRCCPTRTSRR